MMGGFLFHILDNWVVVLGASIRLSVAHTALGSWSSPATAHHPSVVTERFVFVTVMV